MLYDKSDLNYKYNCAGKDFTLHLKYSTKNLADTFEVEAISSNVLVRGLQALGFKTMGVKYTHITVSCKVVEKALHLS